MLEHFSEQYFKYSKGGYNNIKNKYIHFIHNNDISYYEDKVIRYKSLSKFILNEIDKRYKRLITYKNITEDEYLTKYEYDYSIENEYINEYEDLFMKIEENE